MVASRLGLSSVTATMTPATMGPTPRRTSRPWSSRAMPASDATYTAKTDPVIGRPSQASRPTTMLYAGGWVCRYQTLPSGSWARTRRSASCQ
jgi:hypothetical protein